MKKNPFFKDVKPLSRQQLKGIKGGATLETTCYPAGGPCGATIVGCCPGLKCVIKVPSFFGTCTAS
jgi:hypothetical protein